MTKLELKAKYSEWNINNYYKADKRNKEIFNKMQFLASENCLPVYCSMQELLKELINTKDCYLAFSMYDEYRENEGRKESMKELALSTNNFQI